MMKRAVHFDFSKFPENFTRYVRFKAIEAGNTITYATRGNIVEEDPRTQKIKVLRPLFDK